MLKRPRPWSLRLNRHVFDSSIKMTLVRTPISTPVGQATQAHYLLRPCKRHQPRFSSFTPMTMWPWSCDFYFLAGFALLLVLGPHDCSTHIHISFVSISSQPWNGTPNGHRLAIPCGSPLYFGGLSPLSLFSPAFLPALPCLTPLHPPRLPLRMSSRYRSSSPYHRPSPHQTRTMARSTPGRHGRSCTPNMTI